MSSMKSQSDGSWRGPSNSSGHLPAHKPYVPYRSCWLQNHEQISLQESLDGPEAEVTSTDNSIYKIGKCNRGNQFIEEYCRKANPKADGSACFDQQRKVDDSFVKLEQHSDIQDLNAIIGDDLQKMAVNKDFHESCVADTCIMDLYSSQESQHSGKLCSDLDSCWIGVNKAEPWWRTNDRGDLASILTSESLKHTESGDIPCPENSGSKSTCLLNFDQVKGQITSDTPTEADSVSIYLASASMEKASFTPSATGCSPHSSESLSSKEVMEKASFMPSVIGCSLHGSKSLSSDNGPSAGKLSSVQTQQANPDVSRVQLLEALCRSQTRAREAEILAQQVCDEKEQIINLYFRQASHLFAYRQWVEILRLEALYLQFRKKGVYISSQLKKGRWRTGKRKPGKSKPKMSKSFVAFAVGLGLASAGLLLGWSIGWLLPTF